MKSFKQLENPLPHFAKATDAAGKILKLQKDLFQANAELKTQQAVQRAVAVAVGMVLANAALVLSLFWVTSALHDAGWSPWALAAASLVILGSISMFILKKALTVSSGGSDETRDENSRN